MNFPKFKSKSKTKTPEPSAERSKILEQRRLRNIESAKRSRERLKNEPEWIEIQMRENEERIIQLEKKIGGLEQELQTSPKKPASSSVRHSIHFGNIPKTEKRPEWFGEPF